MKIQIIVNNQEVQVANKIMESVKNVMDVNAKKLTYQKTTFNQELVNKKIILEDNIEKVEDGYKATLELNKEWIVDNANLLNKFIPKFKPMLIICKQMKELLDSFAKEFKKEANKVNKKYFDK